jgi:drug/metabolite transporter (DMT)-like permease
MTGSAAKAGAAAPHTARAYAALSAVCFFWGTTYLAIRMGLESFPPLTLVAIRFTVSGSLLLAVAVLSGVKLPPRRELGTSALTGILLLGGSNTCLVFSETWIPSGLAALIIALSPFWLVGTEALLPGGARLHRPTIAGMLVGLAGVALLLLPDLRGQGFGTGALLVRGFVVLQFANAFWSFGSIYYRRQPATAHPIVSGAIQQLAAGLAIAVPALLVPQRAVVLSWRGVGGVAYLVVFGSIVGYSAYIYALSHLPVAVVSIYPYVNTVVAVLLGWWFYREPFGLNEAAAMAVIFAGVALVKRSTLKR